jgi:short-chain fatty acids transporter
MVGINFTKTIETIFKRFMPSPFAIALLLTLVTLVMAFLFTSPPENKSQLATLVSYWEQGIWNNQLLVFAYQMMLVLVLGHILVLSSPATKLINRLIFFVNNTTTAVVLVSVCTMLVSFFNWGLGLIFGAIMARKIAELSREKGFPINYPLVGASGYVGLMIWHGGISGSAPLKVSESGHLKSFMGSSQDISLSSQLPDLIPFSKTVLSISNLLLFLILLVVIPFVLYKISKNSTPTKINLPIYKSRSTTENMVEGAEKFDHFKWVGIFFGLLILGTFFYQYSANLKSLIITPNMLNFFMLGVALILHKTVASFLLALSEAIKGASGILIQFPLYFGIMGIMSSSGMVVEIADFFVSIATKTTLPLFTFISAGIVNIFVPSGGGQWAIQGPIVIESALKLGVPLPKAIMALAYGDQLTNMLQPFWALPLLGITQLKAKEILPYTLVIMLVGFVVFTLGLLFLF